MTAISDWRKAYRLLRHNCGLTHYQARAIFAEHLGGLSFHRNMLHAEYVRDAEGWAMEAQTFALLLRSDQVVEFINALNHAIWDDGDEPLLCYTLIRGVSALVREWCGWGEAERRLIQEQIRRVLNYENRTGLEAWTERHLMTYLRINGVAIEV